MHKFSTKRCFVTLKQFLNTSNGLFFVKVFLTEQSYYRDICFPVSNTTTALTLDTEAWWSSGRSAQGGPGGAVVGRGPTNWKIVISNQAMDMFDWFKFPLWTCQLTVSDFITMVKSCHITRYDVILTVCNRTTLPQGGKESSSVMDCILIILNVIVRVVFSWR